ncbi:hypothetical protein lpari_02119 [Legionella parisiensis]|uniref:Uncharacterized protein n=1 Tax=Legionella parisiensis TaxID=45071 RepID=A0A1E5JQU4_9GAMM|nr:hypothetical protein lpari_02119 [Legionella parisiensis]
MTNDHTSNPTSDSQALLNQIIIDYMKEAKRKRRWKWFMRVIYLLIIAYIVYYVSKGTNEDIGTNIKAHRG